MSVFKCKMCGGTLTVTGNERIVECDYCFSTQTIPVCDNEKKIALFNRANNMRRRCEFDLAMVTYSAILSEDPEDAEANFGMVLCRFGIEYVDDPKTGRKVPTCHRTMVKPIFDDEYYRAAIKYADPVAREIYQKEAAEIDAIQKEIIALSRQEEPYDVFICYKETDENGNRTNDSVIAQDIYDQVSAKGYRVFFARITLEDKLGSAYEPIIFAALTSAKVMLAIGTDPNYFEAVWVKNEWSRYLSFMKADRTKTLIPCYKDMDAYDLPQEFKNLQAQDMAKIGFIQDLVRGIDKLLGGSKPKAETVQVVTGKTSFKRVDYFLEQGKFREANDVLERILDSDYENAEAYAYKMLCNLQVKSFDELIKTTAKIEDNENYKTSLSYADAEYKIVLEGYLSAIITNRKEVKYKLAAKYRSDKNYSEAIYALNTIVGYKDSEQLIAEIKKESQFFLAQTKFNGQKYLDCELILKTIIDFKGAQELLEESIDCRIKGMCKKVTDLPAVIYYIEKGADLPIYFNKTERLKDKYYQLGIKEKNSKNYKNALEIFGVLATLNYKDSEQQKADCIKCIELSILAEKEKQYQSGLTLFNKAFEDRELDGLNEAKTIFGSLEGYKDSDDYCLKAQRMIDDIKREIALNNKRKKLKIAKVALLTVSSVAVAVATLVFFVIPTANFLSGVKSGEKGEYNAAINKLSSSKMYDYQAQIDFVEARKALKDGDYETAIKTMFYRGGTVDIEYKSTVATIDTPTKSFKKLSEYVNYSNDPSFFGYSFTGWSLMKYDMNTSYGKYRLSLQLNAVFSIDNYEISFDLSGGSYGKELPTKYNVNSQITIGTPKKEGFTFKGWTGTDLDTYSPTIEITKGTIGRRHYVANWDAKIYTVKLNWNDNEDNPTIRTEKVCVGSSMSFATPYKVGYKFVDWYFTDGTRFAEKELWNRDQEVELIAKWDREVYTITYELDGGENSESNPSSYTIEDGVIKLVAPTKEYYDFVGWKIDEKAEAEAEKNIDTKMARDITLIAVWSQRRASFNYIVNGGLLGDSRCLFETVYDGTFFELPVPEKDGYVFGGWYLDESLSCGFDFDSVSEYWGCTLTLYAKYTPDSRTKDITLYSNGGYFNRVPTANNEITLSFKDTNFESVNLTAGQEYTLPIPSKEGYAFMGWEQSGRSITRGSIIYDDVALSPMWSGTSRDLLSNSYSVWLGAGYSDDSVPYSYRDILVDEDAVIDITSNYSNSVCVYEVVSSDKVTAFASCPARGVSVRRGQLLRFRFFNSYSTFRLEKKESIDCTVKMADQLYSINDFRTYLSFSVTPGEPFGLPIPSRGGYLFKGWGLSQFATASVPLEGSEWKNEYIQNGNKLYAIWELE